MTIQAWLDGGTYYTCLGHRIFVQLNHNSEKPVVVLLHGFPTSSWDWYKMWPLLSTHFNIVAPDFLGFGFSDKPYPFPYTIPLQVDILEDLLEQIQIKSCYVVAHNYAVSAVQELLWRRIHSPEAPKTEIRGIILLNGGLFPETHRARPIQRLLLGPFGKYINRLLSKASLRKNLNQIFGPETQPSDNEIDGFWAIINFNKGKRCFHLLIRYMIDRVQNRTQWLSALQETDVPVKLVNGPEDPISGRHMVERYQKLIENADVAILPGIGHYPNVEAADKVSRITIDYFNKIEQGNSR